MDRKVLGVVFLVFGIIALIGSAVFMFVLSVVGTGIGSIRDADPEFLAQAGTDAASVQTFYEQASQVMIVAWVWAVSSLIASLASVYSGILKLRQKSKK